MHPLVAAMCRLNPVEMRHADPCEMNGRFIHLTITVHCMLLWWYSLSFGPLRTSKDLGKGLTKPAVGHASFGTRDDREAVGVDAEPRGWINLYKPDAFCG